MEDNCTTIIQIIVTIKNIEIFFRRYNKIIHCSSKLACNSCSLILFTRLTTSHKLWFSSLNFLFCVPQVVSFLELSDLPLTVFPSWLHHSHSFSA